MLVHIGQTEEAAGIGGGEKMGAAGVKHALCVNQEVGNAALELRCKGFQEGLAKADGGTIKEIGVNLSNPTQTQQTIEAALQHDPTIDGILTLGPTGASPTIKALQDLNKLGQIKLATFDLSSDVLNAIKAGQMLFALTSSSISGIPAHRLVDAVQDESQYYREQHPPDWPRLCQFV